MKGKLLYFHYVLFGQLLTLPQVFHIPALCAYMRPICDVGRSVRTITVQQDVVAVVRVLLKNAWYPLE